MELRDARGLTESEFLAQYKRKDYPRPSFTVDMAVFSKDEEGRLQMLMVRRGGHPFLGCWALPGGFVNQDEDADTAAMRELSEETGISGLKAEQLGVYSAPGRDPRGWTISAAYVSNAGEQKAATAGDDATEAVWCRLETRAREDGAYEMKVHAGDDALRSTFEVSEARFMPPRARVLDSYGFAFDHAQIAADAWLALSQSACADGILSA